MKQHRVTRRPDLQCPDWRQVSQRPQHRAPRTEKVKLAGSRGDGGSERTVSSWSPAVQPGRRRRRRNQRRERREEGEEKEEQLVYELVLIVREERRELLFRFISNFLKFLEFLFKIKGNEIFTFFF